MPLATLFFVWGHLPPLPPYSGAYVIISVHSYNVNNKTYAEENFQGFRGFFMNRKSFAYLSYKCHFECQ